MTRSLLLFAVLLLAAPSLSHAADPKIEMVSTGKGKKSPLRLAPSKGAKTSLVMTMRMQMKMTMAGNATPSVPMPQIDFRFDSHVLSVKKNGDFEHGMTVSEVIVHPKKDAPPPLIEALRSAVGGMKGLKMVATTTSRGFVRDTTMDIPKGVTPIVKKMMEDMRNSMRQMSSPLPAEAVGQGATWKVHQAIDQGGMHIVQVAHVTLEKIEGSRITMAMRMEQTAPGQEVKNDQLPPGATVRLEKLAGSGSGSLVLDLKRATPHTGDVQADSHIEMTLSMPGAPGGGAMSMVTDTSIQVGFRSK